jgi:pSer/pThr/pTyr-binding forkhead associated (FHA) protein
MMCKVVLKARSGALPQRSYQFFGRTLCVIGRSAECSLQVPGPEVSRRHCLLDVDPPMVHIRDLGSRNGTYVNGESIGHRETPLAPDTLPIQHLPSRELHVGDRLQVGNTVFDVEIVAEDGTPNPEVTVGELMVN